VGDFSDDGIPDLVLADTGNSGNPGPGTVSVLLGKGDGTFEAAVKYPAGLSPIWVAVADFNGDSILDLAVASTGHDVSVLLGKGDGTFHAAVNYASGPYSDEGNIFAFHAMSWPA
jgi:hypothetical protein